MGNQEHLLEARFTNDASMIHIR